MSQKNNHNNQPSRQTPAISAEEAALFRQAVGWVEPVHDDRRPPDKHTPSPHPPMREADEPAVMTQLLTDSPADLDIDTGEHLTYYQPGIQPRIMRRLRRGHYRCQAELDLHGMVVAVARQSLLAFLEQARQRQYRCVRIIHGKGLRSGQRGPVLKIRLAGWLQQCQEVLAYTSARPNDGGTGAVYVLLKR